MTRVRRARIVFVIGFLAFGWEPSWADTPTGSYSIRHDVRATTKVAINGKTLSSCGEDGRRALAPFATVAVRYAKASRSVFVNKSEWIFDNDDASTVTAHESNSRSHRLMVTFKRNQGAALGLMHFFKLDALGNPLCVDTIPLTGTYQP